MKISLIVSLIFSALIMSMCNKVDIKDTSPKTYMMDAAYLASTKTRIENNDGDLKPSFEKLIGDAELALNEGPFSVTHKAKLPPSGNRHDYASYSRYWWPDPNIADGLPYIRRDGETNPASQDPKESDRKRIGALGVNVETLGLAYYLTGHEKYAQKAAELLRVWFLDEETRMNPNMNHAQCRPGHNKGSKSGVLDGRLMTRALEGSLLISGSSALSEREREGLKDWAGAYFNWLSTSEMALQEAATKNNHGSYYDAQAIYFALYAGNQNAAKEIVQKFISNRVYTQILPDGSMPEELARTRPLFYSVYNLHAMFIVASMAEHINMDVWEADKTGSRLRTALEFLAPYADSKKFWPEPTIGEFDKMELFPILQMGYHAYADERYKKLMDKLPVENRSTQRSNLAFPLMR